MEGDKLCTVHTDLLADDLEPGEEALGKVAVLAVGGQSESKVGTLMGALSITHTTSKQQHPEPTCNTTQNPSATPFEIHCSAMGPWPWPRDTVSTCGEDGENAFLISAPRKICF